MRQALLTLERKQEWSAVLEQCGRFDTYHLAEYHAVAEVEGRGRGHLFVYEEGEWICALPFLVRPIRGQPWLVESDLRDAISVYGYAGPVSNIREPDEPLARRFRSALLGTLEREGIVSLFCRLHPLMETQWLLEGPDTIFTHGPTVAIRLDAPPEAQAIEARMAGNRRREIQKLRQSGISVSWGAGRDELGEFVAAYHETMRRTGADERYYFDLAHFQRLADELGEHMRLLTARDGAGDLLAAIVIFATQDLLQYHLSATPDRFVRQSAAKLLIAEAAFWGMRRNMRWFHLGGGLGASGEDGVFRFKHAFSPEVTQFRSARIVSNPQQYAQLCKDREAWVPAMSPSSDAFFPRYRAPAEE